MKKASIFILAGILIGSAATLAASKYFPDVPEYIWYSRAVANLTDKGIIEGYPDGTFGPSKNVNRAELAVMFDRLIEYMETGEVAGINLDNTYSTQFDNLTFSIDYPASSVKVVEYEDEYYHAIHFSDIDQEKSLLIMNIGFDSNRCIDGPIPEEGQQIQIGGYDAFISSIPYSGGAGNHITISTETAIGNDICIYYDTWNGYFDFIDEMLDSIEIK